MAVANKYVDATIVAGKLGNPAMISGANPVILVATFEVAAADDDGSVYRIGKSLSPSLIPVNILVASDAITASTDWDVGLYQTTVEGVTGAVIDKDIFADGLDISAGYAIGSELQGMSAVDLANRTKKLFEHAGHTVVNSLPGYDLALTANTVGTAAGTVTVVATFIQG